MRRWPSPHARVLGPSCCSCGTDLNAADTQIVYCLKDAINKRFLRQLVAGKLDEELGGTVPPAEARLGRRPTATPTQGDQLPARPSCLLSSPRPCGCSGGRHRCRLVVGLA